MTNEEFRRRAHRLIETCGNMGDLGHCISCNRFVRGGVPHAPQCEVAALVAAGPYAPAPAEPARAAAPRGDA